jgi:hypothetical protein
MREAKETSIRQAVAVLAFVEGIYEVLYGRQVPHSLVLTLPRHSPCPLSSPMTTRRVAVACPLSNSGWTIIYDLTKKTATMRRAFLW